MRPLILVALVVATLALPAPTHAAPCHGSTFALNVGGETLYIDDAGPPNGDRNLAIYRESNDVPGLQRGSSGLFTGTTFPFLAIGVCIDQTDGDQRVYP